MLAIHIGLVAVSILVLISIFLGIVLGPANFFGYVLYSAGFMITAHGIDFFGFKLNTTYLFAIYPLAFRIHWFLWWVGERTVKELRGIEDGLMRWLSRVLTFIPILIFSIGMWYAIGMSLQWFAVEFTSIDTSVYSYVEDFIHNNFYLFEIIVLSAVVITYAIRFIILGQALKHEDAIERLPWKRM